VPQIDVKDLTARMQRDEVAVIDVRGRSEWEAGHIPGVENTPAGFIADHLDDLPRDRPLVVHCQSGARSAIAASVLRANGVTNVVNLSGGFAAWKAAGHRVEAAEPTAFHGVDR